jgi:uncharacterized membrane protein
MKSTIVFFDTHQNSVNGTLRGLIILPIFLILSLIWYFSTKKLYQKHIDNVSTSRKVIGLLIIGSLIVSAIAVSDCNTRQKAIVYSLLVGFVIYGISNCVLLMTSNKWNYIISVIDLLWGIFSTGLLGFILFYIVKFFPSLNVV